MPYDREQRNIQRRIIRIGRRRGMPRDAILSALATGGVESNWRNLSYGDRDSQGWRQERGMYYSNPRNLNASINRYYDEWKADTNPRDPIGKQAQDVQQSAFPERYQGLVDDAKRILRGAPGGRGGTSTVTTRIPGIDNSGLRQQYLQGYLQQRGQPGALLDLAAGLSSAQDVPGRTITRSFNRSGRKLRKGPEPSVRGGIHEVFHDPLGRYYDEGRIVEGAIGNHDKHVHVSAEPRVALQLGRMARRRGLTVRENPFFDPVDPVHTGGSYHYKSKRIRRRGGGLSRRRVGYAIDVSGGTAEARADFARDVMRLAR